MAIPNVVSGTLSLTDLLVVNNTSIIDFGRYDVFAAIRAYMDTYNRIVNEMLGMFVMRTKERVTGLAGTAAMVARYTDEYGVVDPQKVVGPTLMGFPLRKSQVTLQWTYQWMRKHTPQEMAAQVQAMTIADVQKVQSALRTAIFKATNTSFVDTLWDSMTIPVKAFANADGFPIPAGPNGDTFNPATHTHYIGTANAHPSASDIAALLGNVTEHVQTGVPVLLLPQTEGDYISGNLSSYPEFRPLQYTGQFTAITTTYANEGDLDRFNPTNRMLGLYRGAEVWVKPWVPSTAIAAMITGNTDSEKPIAMRVPADLGGDNGDFRTVFEDDQYPTECKLSEREFGLAPRNRVGVSVLSFGGGDTTYVQPTGL